MVCIKIPLSNIGGLVAMSNLQKLNQEKDFSLFLLSRFSQSEETISTFVVQILFISEKAI